MKTAEFEPVEPQTDPYKTSSADDSSKAEASEELPDLLRLKNIMVPIDFSETSLKALQYAVPFAKQFGAMITLLHVIPPVSEMPERPSMALFKQSIFHAAERQLEKMARSTIDLDVSLQAFTRTGFVFETIVGVAREICADIIIITTHGYTGLKHLLLGSTAECVVRHAPCPVLVVREREHEFV